MRLITLLATAIAFVMATGVPGAFAAEGLWFALPYVAVRVLGLGLQVVVELERREADHRGTRIWVGASMVGLALVLAGAAADPSLRPAFWLAAIAADFGAAALAGRGRDWDLSRAHFAERHGLFVIIAIGESLIIAGTSLVEEPRTAGLIAVAATTLLLASAMWWSYFGWLKEALEHAFARASLSETGSLARDAYSLAHFPLVFGIVGFAVAIKDIFHAPDTPLTGEVLATLGVGVALFTCSAALSYWRLTGRVLVPRLVISAAMLAALFVVAPLPPIWPFFVTAAAVVLIALVEHFRPERADQPVVRARPAASAEYNRGDVQPIPRR